MQYNLINKNKIFIAYGKMALQTFFYNIYGINYSLDIYQKMKLITDQLKIMNQWNINEQNATNYHKVPNLKKIFK